MNTVSLRYNYMYMAIVNVHLVGTKIIFTAPHLPFTNLKMTIPLGGPKTVHMS